MEFCWVGLAIFGVRLAQACARLTHAWVKFSRVALCRFLTAPSVCRGPNCPPPLLGRAENGSDCSWVGFSLPTYRPTSMGSHWAVWGWSDRWSICKCLWGELLQCQMVRVGVSQCLNGGVAYSSMHWFYVLLAVVLDIVLHCQMFRCWSENQVVLPGWEVVVEI